MGDWGAVIGGPKEWARDLTLAVFAGLALAFIGPFGSYGLPLERRLLICLVFGLVGSAVFWPSLRAALCVALRSGLPRLFAMIVALAVAAGPVTAAIYLVRPWLSQSPTPSPLSLYLSVLALCLPIGLAVLLTRRPRAPAAPPAGYAEPRLIARLPAKVRGDLVALQAEDHYVRVHTRAGNALILMRLADAIAETDGEPGLQPHRSWWVARAAVTGARAEGRRGVLVLANALEAPVTRELMPEVRRAGWL
ncbi:MAG: hypothetical protein DI570_00505 [Phenylobacterium zucineum]|nr:MAG: hypothetical protein DI570_00505 [Phenylobacterium zucineum]